ncbi:MAG TPA: ATP-binding protein [Isosphaeraceae bacterium]|jgi:signal transduction histidine kinase
MSITRKAWSYVKGLVAIVGWQGLMSGLIALAAFGYGLGMLYREYDRPGQIEHEVLHNVLANWALAPDYLGKNLVDYADDWREAPEAGRPVLLDRVRGSLRQLGEALERHDNQFPLINVVGLVLRRRDGDPLASWTPRYAPAASTVEVDTIPVAEAGKGPPLDLVIRYQVAAEVDSVVQSNERYYDRMIGALIGLSGASLLCFGTMVLHVFDLRDRVAREAAQEATLDLADRTCHELGNVAFVVSNERRNLAGHIELLERFLAEESAARAAAARSAGLDPAEAARFDQSLRREYAERGIAPDFELRQSTAMARDVCRQIAACSDYISLTVRELDGFLKRTELPVVLGPITVEGVLDEAVTLLAPRLESAGARVERPAPEGGPIRVVGDRRLLTHTLVNLLKNAVEAAAGAGIEPVVTLSARRDGATVWLHVVDNGPGIAESDRRLIFEDGFSTKGAGRGQGLAIVRDSARLQGGRIEVASRPGGGTVFSVGLPAVT